MVRPYSSFYRHVEPIKSSDQLNWAIIMASVLLVVSSRGSSQSPAENGSMLMSYKLAKDYHFDKPQLVRILNLHGSRSHVICCADFVEASDVNGELVPFLGSSLKQSNSWVRLRSNFIPAHGWLHFRSVYNNTPIKNLGNITIWIEIIPAEGVHYK